MPTILTKKSDTPGAIPATANLTNAAGGAELAVNTADKRLFTINSSSAVVELGTNPASLTCADVSATVLRAGSATITNLIATTATVSDFSATVARISSLTISSLSLSNATFGSATITNLTSTSATISSALTLTGGTANGVLYLNGSKVATSGSALTFDGTAVGIGQASGTSSGFSTAPNLLVYGATNANILVAGDSSNVGVTSARYTNTTGGGILRVAKYRGTYASPSAAQTGDLAGDVRFEVWGGSNLRRVATIGGTVETFTSDTDISGYLAFNTTSSGTTTPTEKMRLTAAGNLGIGTSSPSGFLANKLVIATGGTANEGMTIYSSSNNGSIWFADATTGTGRYAGGLDYTHSDDTLIFYSAAQGNMRLNASGNLGLGVTPSASSVKTFEIGSVGNTLSGIGGGDIALMSNAYYDNAFKYAGSNLAASYRLQDGVHKWNIAASGTAGNTISFTQAMTLDASGQLALGTSTASTTLGRNITINGTNAGTNTGIVLQSAGTERGYLYGSDSQIVLGSSTSIPALFVTGGSERARITSGGDFCVGTTSAYTGGKISVNGGIVSPSGNQFVIGVYGSSGLQLLGTTGGDNIVGTMGASEPLVFRTASSERARIDSSGNVGIGTSSPGQKLEVAGNIFINSSGNPYMEVKTSGAGNNPYLKLTADTNNWVIQGTFSNSTDDFILQYNSSNRFVLNSSGQLGVYATSGNGGRVDIYSNNQTATQVTLAQGFATATDNIGYLINRANEAFVFGTNNTERARITSGGALLVGTTSALAAGGLNGVHCFTTGTSSEWAGLFRNSNASTPVGVAISYSGISPNAASNPFFYCSDSTALRAAIYSNGGLYNYQANDSNLSDERMKTDIKPVESYWNKIKAIEIVTFKYKDQTHDDDNVGVIAQQVESVAPEFVNNDGFGETPEDGVPLKTIYTTDMYHAAIKALQEAMVRIEKLEAEVAALKGA